jgi:hypothetical protein
MENSMNNSEKIQEFIDIAKINNVRVDRWNNIKWVSKDGKKEYRYNIKKNVIRFENRVIGTSGWFRIRSYKISDLSFESWEGGMKIIFDKQNNY